MLQMKLTNFFQSIVPGITVGLDVGTYSVKAAQIKEKRFSGKKFLSFGVKDIKQPDSRESVVTAIKALYDEIKPDSNRVNLSIYGADIIMRYIPLPSLEAFDLSHCLEFELERYIPGKQKDTMVIDYKILYRLANKQMVVLLIAAEREVIERRISLARDAGLEPNSMNVDCLALMEAFKAMPVSGKGKEVVAILDIGYSVSKLVVFQENIPYFSRDIMASGIGNFLQLMSENMGLDPIRAQDLMFNPGDKLKEIIQACKLGLDTLTDELRLSFEYCGRNLQKKVSQLYLCGGGSKIKILDEALTASLNLKTKIFDVTSAFAVSSPYPQDKSRELSPLIAVAVGLAMS